MFRSMALAAAAAVTVAVAATPASAQHTHQTAYKSGYTTADQGWRNDGWASNGWSNNGWNDDWRNSSAFWPGAVAAGVVGGAVGTAGAIVAAPFEAVGGYDRGSGSAGYWRQSYAQRNGFVCTPGTLTRMNDGLLYRCQ
jgi:hypothetical protein